MPLVVDSNIHILCVFCLVRTYNKMAFNVVFCQNVVLFNICLLFIYIALLSVCA